MDTNTPLVDLFPSRWLKAKDLTDAGLSSITARVDRVTIEDVKPQPQEPAVQRLALWLHGCKPYLVTSKADAGTLAEYGATTPAQLVGKTLAVRLDVWRRQAVLRIAPPSAVRSQAKPAPVAAQAPAPVATAPASPSTNGATSPTPPATSPAPVATSAQAGSAAAVQSTPAAPPVATSAPVAAPAAQAQAGDAHLWPPRGEAWVSRKARTGEVDWVTSFWQCGAALKVSREHCKSMLEANGGSFEDAAQQLWEQAQAQNAAAASDEFPAF